MSSTTYAQDARPAVQILEVVDHDGTTVLTTLKMHAKVNLCPLDKGRHTRAILGFGSDRIPAAPVHITIGKGEGADTNAIIEVSPRDMVELLQCAQNRASIMVEARAYSAAIAGKSAIRQGQLGGPERPVFVRLTPAQGATNEYL